MTFILILTLITVLAHKTLEQYPQSQRSPFSMVKTFFYHSSAKKLRENLRERCSWGGEGKLFSCAAGINSIDFAQFCTAKFPNEFEVQHKSSQAQCR